MPVYDCGNPDCCECQRVFGPDRSGAIAHFKNRERAYAALATSTADAFDARRQAAGGGGREAEKVRELAALNCRSTP